MPVVNPSLCSKLLRQVCESVSRWSVKKPGLEEPTPCLY